MAGLLACSRPRRRRARDDGGASDDASSTTTTAPTTATTAPTTTTAAPAGQAARGRRAGRCRPSPTSSTRRPTLGGYGVVLANPNPDLMATGVRVVTRILDPAGAELLVDSTLLNGILPGQRMAVGRTLIEPIEEPTTLDVKVEVTAWLPPASTDGRAGRRGASSPNPRRPAASVTRFTVRSTWPDVEDGVDVTAVYRAEDGRILGAESTSIDVPARRTRRRPHPPALPHPRPRPHRGLRRSGLRRPHHRLTPSGAPPCAAPCSLCLAVAALAAGCGDDEPTGRDQQRRSTPVEVDRRARREAHPRLRRAVSSHRDRRRALIEEGDGDGDHGRAPS